METSAIRTLAASSWALHPGSPQPGGEILDSQRIYHIPSKKSSRIPQKVVQEFRLSPPPSGHRPWSCTALPPGRSLPQMPGVKIETAMMSTKAFGAGGETKKEHESMVVLGDGVIGFSSLATLRITSSTSSWYVWYELHVESQHVSQHICWTPGALQCRQPHGKNREIPELNGKPCQTSRDGQTTDSTWFNL